MWRQGDTRVVPRDAVVEHNSCRFVLGNPPRLESLLLVQDQGPAEPIIAHGSPIADTDLASWFRNSSYTLGERSVRYEVLPIAVSPHPPVLHSAVRCNVAWVAASGAMGAACGVASASVAAIRGRDREAAQGVRGADVLAAGIVGCLMGSVGALAFGGLTWEHSIQVTLAPGFESGKRRISFSSPGSGSASECADSACVVLDVCEHAGQFQWNLVCQQENDGLCTERGEPDEEGFRAQDSRKSVCREAKLVDSVYLIVGLPKRSVTIAFV
ncbi:hypothetical protein Pelo_10051 [Pelomyxa schiedti]|nr:hypothetical protein Pelo_10051 [Pelomyxa schiedti]